MEEDAKYLIRETESKKQETINPIKQRLIKKMNLTKNNQDLKQFSTVDKIEKIKIVKMSKI
jgi:hypothetical protein